MNSEHIFQGLQQKFHQCRIVIWQDTEQEFTALLEDFNLVDAAGQPIQVIRLDESALLQVKTHIELEAPKRSFLLYSTHLDPAPERDWLYDIRLYAEHFYADSSSLILNELNMRMEFRHVIMQHRAFFAHKARLERLKNLLPAQANQRELELALIAATLKVDSARFDAILKHILQQVAKWVREVGSLEGMVQVTDHFFTELAKYQLLDAFWHLIKEELAYQPLIAETVVDAQESLYQLKDLVVSLWLTECYQGLQNSGVALSAPVLDFLSSQLLPRFVNADATLDTQKMVHTGMNSTQRATAVDVVKSLRNHRATVIDYNSIAHAIEQDYLIQDQIKSMDNLQHLAQLETFECVEQHFIRLLAKQIHTLPQVEVEHWVAERLTKHWAQTQQPHQPNYYAMLQALKAAKQFLTLQQKYIDGFHYDSAQALYRAYEQELFLIDKAYRHFCFHADTVAQHGSDLFKATGLVDEIQQGYTDWYIHDLAIAWDQAVAQDQLLKQWQLHAIPNQYDFYKKQVLPILKTPQVKKVFVIISDALRYDVAEELHERINHEQRYISEIGSQLGVLPSYTQLGMASLLPHQELTAHLSQRVEYKADGLSVHGHENRNKILVQPRYQGVAFKANDVLKWTKEEGRKQIKDAAVIYIYHDHIDAIGDKAATEHQTFTACHQAIEELKQLVNRVFNGLNGSRVLLTADHGFLFQTQALQEADKTALTVQPQGSVEAKKRYIIGTDLPQDQYYLFSKLSITAQVKAEHDAEFLVPRGSNRFNFIGGSRFVHGGLMPQEICVPILTVRQLTKHKQAPHLKKPVSVMPLGQHLKLVALADKIEFFQVEPVSADVMAREIQIWVADEKGQCVSDKPKVLFDMRSDQAEERKRRVVITLKGAGFNRRHEYKLMMHDVTQPKSPQFLQSHSVKIDIAFEDDFF
tara:strand:+ start:1222 stop:3990 length:2769 start_codon:yes stop_codon:yes gene_type:complete